MDVEALYTELKAAILHGSYAAGQSLVETTIAKNYDVSRLYVKSAFQKLAAERLVEHRKNRGYFVLEVPNSLLEEIADIRQALEGVIVKRVIHIGKPEHFAKLTQILNRIDVFIRNEMIEDGLDEVDRFYAYLYEISGYERVASILHTYSDYIAIIRKRSAATQAEHLSSLESMRMMLETMIAKDEKKALQHIENRQETLFF